MFEWYSCAMDLEGLIITNNLRIYIFDASPKSSKASVSCVPCVNVRICLMFSIIWIKLLIVHEVEDLHV